MNEFERIADKFHEILLEFALNEMGRSRSAATQYLVSQSVPFATHVCKIMLWGNQSEQWLKDWSDEMFTYCKNVAETSLLKGKRLKREDYINHFFNGPIGDSKELKSKLVNNKKLFIQRDKYPEPNYLINANILYEKYVEFVKAVLDMVADNNMDYHQFLKACELLIGV